MDSEAVPARDSLEPLRSANALSNSAGGGVLSAAAALGAPGGAPARVKMNWGPTRSKESRESTLEAEKVPATWAWGRRRIDRER